MVLRKIKMLIKHTKESKTEQELQHCLSEYAYLEEMMCDSEIKEFEKTYQERLSEINEKFRND